MVFLVAAGIGAAFAMMAGMEIEAIAVAVIGLGGIAEKAYLPALGNRADLDLRLMTRDRRKLDAFGDAYRVPGNRRFTDLEALIADGVDAAFVHVATAAHAEVVGRLLDAGIPTYADKPLTYTLEGSRRLVEQAERTGTPLMVGFNRRYVPAYVAASQRPREVVILQKNEANASGPVRDIVFDDFIHVVDTLRFLAPAPIADMAVSGSVIDDQLHHVAITLSGPGFTAIGVMNRVSRAKQERLQIGSHEIVDLLDGPPGWTPIARQRGIEQICQRFLDGLQTGDFPDLRDALASHEICEQIVSELSA